MAVAVSREPRNFPCETCDCTPDFRSASGLKWKVPGVIESEFCFRRLLTQRSLFFLELYRHYKNGVLPVAGGLLDQPYSYFRAMSIIDDWMKRDG